MVLVTLSRFHHCREGHHCHYYCHNDQHCSPSTPVTVYHCESGINDLRRVFNFQCISDLEVRRVMNSDFHDYLRWGNFFERVITPLSSLSHTLSLSVSLSLTRTHQTRPIGFEWVGLIRAKGFHKSCRSNCLQAIVSFCSIITHIKHVKYVKQQQTHFLSQVSNKHIG